MEDRLLAEFPDVTYETWRAQVEKDLKGADFEKRLVTRTLDGIAVQPLYSARDVAGGSDPGGFAGLPPYRRGSLPVGKLGSPGLRWDVRAEQRSPSLAQASQDIAEDLAGGASSLWLRFDRQSRLGLGAGEKCPLDGLPCSSSADLATLLEHVNLAQTPVALDPGGNTAIIAAYLSETKRRGVAPASLRGSLGCDPLGALVRDGALPYNAASASDLVGQLAGHVVREGYGLRALHVSTVPYHDAGATSAHEIAYALATGLEYLRWALASELSVEQASAQIGFGLAVAGDLFMELAKLRAMRLCWAKLIAAHGGSADAQNTTLHAVTSTRTKTLRDPWVNMLRTTTEAFSAMVGGADALTTRGFDEVVGVSDSFARRIARNTQIILNEEAHVAHVADAAGGSYYVETLTDALARDAWQQFQEIERRGGMSAAIASDSVARDLAEIASKRTQAVAKRTAPITGVSEFPNVDEEPVVRPIPDWSGVQRTAASEQTTPALTQLSAAAGVERIAAAVAAADSGGSIAQLTSALAQGAAGARCEPLPVRRQAQPFEALRERSERHVAKTSQPPRAFLCNLGSIPQHKARASFAAGFLGAGGVVVIDNEGFSTPELALEAFAAAKTNTVVLCGSDEQYPEWVPTLVPLLRERGATQVLLAGRPGDHEASFTAAGVSQFIFVGIDVVTSLERVLDRMGVAS